jgi:hypothetical protein
MNQPDSFLALININTRQTTRSASLCHHLLQMPLKERPQLTRLAKNAVNGSEGEVKDQPISKRDKKAGLSRNA